MMGWGGWRPVANSRPDVVWNDSSGVLGAETEARPLMMNCHRGDGGSGKLFLAMAPVLGSSIGISNVSGWRLEGVLVVSPAEHATALKPPRPPSISPSVPR